MICNKKFCVIILFLIPWFIFPGTEFHEKDFLNAFKDYEDSVFDEVSSIEFIEESIVKIHKNDKLYTHYIKKTHFIYDLEKKKIYSKVMEFTLLGGKNENKEKAGDEKKQKLKTLYGFTDTVDNKWKDIFHDPEKRILRFRTNHGFSSFIVEMNYDPGTWFPFNVTMRTEDSKLEMKMNYSLNSGLYLLDSFSMFGSAKFLLDEYKMDTVTKRNNYIIKKKNK